MQGCTRGNPTIACFQHLPGAALLLLCFVVAVGSCQKFSPVDSATSCKWMSFLLSSVCLEGPDCPSAACFRKCVAGNARLISSTSQFLVICMHGKPCNHRTRVSHLCHCAVWFVWLCFYCCVVGVVHPALGMAKSIQHEVCVCLCVPQLQLTTCCFCMRSALRLHCDVRTHFFFHTPHLLPYCLCTSHHGHYHQPSCVRVLLMCCNSGDSFLEGNPCGVVLATGVRIKTFN